MIVLGMDPGFASFGWVVYNAKTQHVLDVGVIRTKKAKKQKGVKLSASQDNLQRAQLVYLVLRDVVRKHCPVDFAVESMSFPRSSSVSQKMGVVWGVVSALAAAPPETAPGVHLAPMRVLQASPQHIKKSLCGAVNATKEEVQAKLAAAHPPMRKWAAENGKGLHEHAFDALAAAVVLSREQMYGKPEAAGVLRQGRRRELLRRAPRIRWRRS